MKYDHSHFNAQKAYACEVNDRIGRFIPMVRKLAWYYEASTGPSLDVDDLFQAGMIALTECARRHERPSEDGFAAYAKMRVRGAMIDLLRSHSHHVRGAAAIRRKIDAAVDTLRQQNGREPCADEIASHLGMATDEYHKAREQITLEMVDLENCYSDSNSAFASQEPDAERNLLDQADKAALAQAIGELPQRLQLVIQLIFVEEMNLTEIAEVLEVSVPRVHQLKVNALKKLKVSLLHHSED